MPLYMRNGVQLRRGFLLLFMAAVTVLPACENYLRSDSVETRASRHEQSSADPSAPYGPAKEPAVLLSEKKSVWAAASAPGTKKRVLVIKKNEPPVSIRNNPSENGRRIGVIKGGSAAVKLAKKRDWFRIRSVHDGSAIEGWISKYSVEGFSRKPYRKETKNKERCGTKGYEFSPL